jgi:putative MATE family efflux protein
VGVKLPFGVAASSIIPSGGRVARPPRPPGVRGIGPQKSFLALAWPSIVENVLLTAMGIVTMMMVGRLGPTAVAGVGAANQVMNLLIVVFGGLAVGTTSLVARRVGAGDRASAASATIHSLAVGLLLGLVVAVVGVIIAFPGLRLMGAEEEVARDGGIYLQGVMATTHLMVIMLIGNGSLRGSGNTRTPMINTAVANVVNVAVAYPLIFGVAGLPALGLVGAAWGVAAARLVGAAMVTRSILAGQSGGLWGLLRGFRPDRVVLRALMAIGGPAAAESGSIQVGMMIFSLMVISMGTDAFASQQIVFNVANLSMMPGLAFSVASTTLVGQALGAGDPDDAERNGWRGTRLAALWMSVMGAVFIIFPEQIIGLYTTDTEVIRLGATGLRVIGFGQPMQGIAFVLAGALRGAGDTKTTLVVGTASMWLSRLPIAYLLGLVAGLGVFGIWLAWAADWLVRSCLYAWKFRQGAWKTIRI